MPSIWNASLSLAALVILLPSTLLATESSTPLTPRESARDGAGRFALLEYDAVAASTKFALPCHGCFGPQADADESLVVDLRVGPSVDHPVVLNGETLDFAWTDGWTESSVVLELPDYSFNTIHTVTISWVGYFATALPDPSSPLEGDATQNFHFHLDSVDGRDTAGLDAVGFVLITKPLSELRLLRIMSEFRSGSDLLDFADFVGPRIHSGTSHLGNVEDADEMRSMDHHEMFDLVGELEDLGALEAHAAEILAQITAKREGISQNMRKHRKKLRLKHLVKECDDILCAAKVIVQRVCDKVGIDMFSYAKIDKEHLQHFVASHTGTQDAQQINGASNKAGHLVDAAHLPLMMTKNGSASSVHFVDTSNVLIRALQAIAAVLGLTILFTFVKRKCMSMRKRVERAADREQRQNERAYRRAARRALIRKRWDNFVNAFNCFGHGPPPRMEDYDEKRALILQDAFLEQDFDQMEKGDVMEAEIRELRHAHEIVSSLVRGTDIRNRPNCHDLIAPPHDPPPPLVPLPYTPASRSRASTTTLPSYTSECLPDYSSRQSGDEATSLYTYSPSSASSEDDENGRSSPSSATSDFSRSGDCGSETRYSPTSSILDMSPRPSAETLRVRAASLMDNELDM